MEASIDLINIINAKNIEVFYSPMIIDGSKKAPDFINKKLERILHSIRTKRLVPLSKEVRILAEKYILYDVLKAKSIKDAQHIAVAVLNEVDYIIS